MSEQINDTIRLPLLALRGLNVFPGMLLKAKQHLFDGQPDALKGQTLRAEVCQILLHFFGYSIDGLIGQIIWNVCECHRHLSFHLLTEIFHDLTVLYH